MSSYAPESINANFEQSSPFSLDNQHDYEIWRDRKLENYPTNVESLIINVDNLANLTANEKDQILAQCAKTNTAIYRSRKAVKDKQVVRQLGRQLGLVHLDENLCADDGGISGLQVMQEGTRHEGYIPYTNKPLNWHTDGYYNPPERQIRAMTLHCISDAAIGGENAILDHEIVYILMRDYDPSMIKAFMQMDAMIIPENIEHGVLIREAQSGPIFSVDNNSGHLHMRYTARTRSIEWKQDAATQKAVAFVKDLLTNDCEYIFNYRLQPGDGIISNNALHNRASFKDDDSGKSRLLYRARYFDRVQ